MKLLDQSTTNASVGPELHYRLTNFRGRQGVKHQISMYPILLPALVAVEMVPVALSKMVRYNDDELITFDFSGLAALPPMVNWT